MSTTKLWGASQFSTSDSREDWRPVPLPNEARISIRSFGYSRPAGQEIASVPSHAQNRFGQNVISTDMVEDARKMCAAPAMYELLHSLHQRLMDGRNSVSRPTLEAWAEEIDDLLTAIEDEKYAKARAAR